MSAPWHNEKVWETIAAHQEEDAATLLLRAATLGLSTEEARFAADQIEGRRQARSKYPRLLEVPRFAFPPKLNREQCSSQATALYKARLVERLWQEEKEGLKKPFVVDITGGMGIDDIFIAPVTERLLHIEQEESLSHLTAWNCSRIGLQQMAYHAGDSRDWIENEENSCDIVLADPARRDSHGHKVHGLEDCSPNILEWLPSIFRRAPWLLLKTSPMTDIRHATQQLRYVREVHVVEYRGECKAVLFLCHREEPTDTPNIYCITLDEEGRPVLQHRFTTAEEAAAKPIYATTVGRYLYEPCAALMKAGPYNSLCRWYNLQALGRNSHLYTGNEVVENFPGRCWEVLQSLKLSAKEIAKVLPKGRAHVVSRNYPIGAPALMQQLKLKEGGELFVVASTLGSIKIGLLCRLLP